MSIWQDSTSELRGVITDGGILCSCRLCNGCRVSYHCDFIIGSWSHGYPLPSGSFGLRLPFHLSSLFLFPPRRLFHLPNLRFMHVTYIRGQHNIFALKMGRACLNYWEHAGQLRYILWRRPFKILSVLHLRKNILLAKVAEVRALLSSCLLLSCHPDHSLC